MGRELVRFSKYMSLVLRHEPEKAGLVLEDGGWVKVDDLVKGARKNGVLLTKALVTEVVGLDEKRRYSFSEEFTKVRANQGHSVNVDIGFEEKEPPPFLFHGTARHNVSSIRVLGVEKRKRQYVHLSPNEDTGVKVGQRHGIPVVLRVSSSKMYEEGHKFFLSENGVWLTEHIPPVYLNVRDGGNGNWRGFRSIRPQPFLEGG